MSTQPTVEIVSPPEGDQFYAGQALRLKGEAFYGNGTIVDASNMEWQVRTYHSDHSHTFLESTFGNDFDLLAAPKPEDLYSAFNSYLEISLRVQETDGLVTESTRIVEPITFQAAITSNIPGTIIRIEDEPITMPEEVWGWKEQKMNLKAEDNPPLLFESWSDGFRDRERTTMLNIRTEPLEARYCIDIGGSCADGGSDLCCIGECTDDAVCTVQVKMPSIYLDTTLPPTMAAPPTARTDTSIELPTLNMNAAGKAMLSITCLMIASIVFSFFYWWKLKEKINPTPHPQPTHWKKFMAETDKKNPPEMNPEPTSHSLTSNSSEEATDVV